MGAEDSAARMDWDSLLGIQAVEYRALLSRHARERAAWLRQRDRDPKLVMSMEQQHLAGIEDAVGMPCMSRSPESNVRCELADRRDAHYKGHEASTGPYSKSSWATTDEEHVRWLTNERR